MQFYHKYEPLLNLNNSEFSVIALTGGRGSQKTGHALRGILFSSMQEKKKTCFFRETKETLNDSLKAELDGIIDTEFNNRGFNYTKENVTHLNGSYMFFKGLKEINIKAIENLKGIATTTDFFVVDEAQAVSKAVWDVLIPTLRKAGCVLIVIYNRIANDLPVEEALFLDYDNMKAPANTYFIEVNYTEILQSDEMKSTLSREFLERAELEQTNRPDEYETKYLNRPNRGNENFVVKYFTDENIKEIHYQPEFDLHITCDFNVDPNCWILAHKTDDKVFFFDEICLENSSTEANTREFIKRYPNHKGRIIINGDASGDNRSTQSEWTNYVIIERILKNHYPLTYIKRQVRPFNPRIKNRVQAFNMLVKDIYGKRRLLVDKKCKWFLYNIKNLKYKEGSDDIETPSYQQIKTDKNTKFLGHPFDAGSYLVEYYFPINKV